MIQIALWIQHIFEPIYKKTVMLLANSKSADQSAHLHRLISSNIVHYPDV